VRINTPGCRGRSEKSGGEDKHSHIDQFLQDTEYYINALNGIII